MSGFDFNADEVRAHQDAGRRVVFDDPTDPDFRSRLLVQLNNAARLITLALPKHASNLNIARQMRDKGFRGTLTATAYFDALIEGLRPAGVHAADNFYNEVGLGFAEHVWSVLEQKTTAEAS